MGLGQPLRQRSPRPARQVRLRCHVDAHRCQQPPEQHGSNHSVPQGCWCRSPIIPSFNANDAEGWANFGKELNAWGAELREHGILLGYHNHGQEFQVYDGRWALEWMLDEVDPENLFLQVDLGWAYDAGVDLIDFINKYEGRILSVHVKDWNEDGSSQVSVGKGVIDWVEVLQAAYEIGGTEWFITEQDGPPSYRVFAYESAVGLSAALNEIMQ